MDRAQAIELLVQAYPWTAPPPPSFRFERRNPQVQTYLELFRESRAPIADMRLALASVGVLGVPSGTPQWKLAWLISRVPGASEQAVGLFVGKADAVGVSPARVGSAGSRETDIDTGDSRSDSVSVGVAHGLEDRLYRLEEQQARILSLLESQAVFCPPPPHPSPGLDNTEKAELEQLRQRVKELELRESRRQPAPDAGSTSETTSASYAEPAVVPSGLGALDPRAWVHFDGTQKSILLTNLRVWYAGVLSGGQFREHAEDLLYNVAAVLDQMGGEDDVPRIGLACDLLGQLEELKAEKTHGKEAAAAMRRERAVHPKAPDHLRRAYDALARHEEVGSKQSRRRKFTAGSGSGAGSKQLPSKAEKQNRK